MDEVTDLFDELFDEIYGEIYGELDPFPYHIAGALTVEKDAGDISITTCDFIGNQNKESGGAIYTTATSLWNTRCSMPIGQDGRCAVYSYYPISGPEDHTIKLDFYSCEFSGNEALGLGGAGYVKTGLLTWTIAS